VDDKGTERAREDRLEHLPEHQIDHDQTAGGRLMSSGATAPTDDPAHADDEHDLDGDLAGDDTRPGLGIVADDSDPTKVTPAPNFRA
jgi:hypothetical protein